MEAAFYFVDVGITVLALYWVVKMAQRKSGEPTSGLFAYFDVIPPKVSRAQRIIAARRAAAPGRNPPSR